MGAPVARRPGRAPAPRRGRARVALADDAGDRARALIRATAGDSAAVAVARVGADDVCGMPSSARGIRRAALGPTLEALADSALGLLDAMLVTETIALPEAVSALAL